MSTTTSPSTLSTSIDQLVANQRVFAIYRLSGDSEPTLVLQDDSTLHEVADHQALSKIKGFVFFPFSAQGGHGNIVVKADEIIKGDDIARVKTSNANATSTTSTDVHSTPRQDFDAAFYKMQEAIDSGEIEKVILSRKIVQQLPTAFSAGSCFMELAAKYPKAHVYVVNLGSGGCWMGASPETLVELSEGQVHTVSLAGTQPVMKGPANWTEKELREQGLVTQYIVQALSRHGAKVHDMAGPETVQAGPVWHLKTKFSAEIANIDSITGFLGDLHPTPAVCGLPKAAAMQVILSTEKHDRSYYCGLAGPWNLEQSKLFVNLRCMRQSEQLAEIFVGVGITAESDMDAEWEETESKASTLLSVLEKM